MKNIKALTLSTAIVSALISSTAMADLTGNIGIASNYIWRGVTQTDDQSAISGGIDYSDESGVYVGTWVSNVDFDSGTDGAGSYEQDFYGGYAADAGDLSYDVGVIFYTYPADTNIDFTEVYVGLGYSAFSLDVALTVDTDAGGDDSDIYVAASGEFEVKKDLMLGVLIGNYDFDAAASEDYTHWQLSLSKNDFTFAFDKHDMDLDDDVRATVSWGKEFEL